MKSEEILFRRFIKWLLWKKPMFHLKDFELGKYISRKYFVGSF